MTPERFWRLVELLGGTADAGSVTRLEAAMAPGEQETFADAVQEHVDRLLAQREVSAPRTGGDTAELVAAAVVAAGRAAYEREAELDDPLDPAQWRWDDAEALLGAGHGPAAGHVQERAGEADELSERLGVWLQWRSVEVPDGVLTSWGAEVAEIDGVLGDDPAFGRVPAADPQWQEALQQLAEDPEFHRRRDAVAGLDLHVVVRDTDEATLTAYPDADAAEHAVLVVPVAAMTAEPDRAEAYVEAVVTLLVSLTEDHE